MVELVIKIPEDVYTRLFDNGIQDNEIAIDDICEMARALRLGIPLSEKLEKIREEVEEKEFKLNCSTMSDVALKTAYTEVAKLLDKHIAELKGENE